YASVTVVGSGYFDPLSGVNGDEFTIGPTAVINGNVTAALGEGQNYFTIAGGTVNGSVNYVGGNYTQVSNPFAPSYGDQVNLGYTNGPFGGPADAGGFIAGAAQFTMLNGDNLFTMSP